jgi:hypothetical protein
MKLTKEKLRQIIKEELSELMAEVDEPFETGGDPLARSQFNQIERESLPAPVALKDKMTNFLWNKVYKILKSENAGLADELWTTADEVVSEGNANSFLRYEQLIRKKLIDKGLEDVIKKATEIESRRDNNFKRGFNPF